MALVYALMGMLVAGVGYSFQRWFQSPPVIIGFALLFVVFALNLLGLFQLSLPQGILQRLDRIQNRQTGGTIYTRCCDGGPFSPDCWPMHECAFSWFTLICFLNTKSIIGRSVPVYARPGYRSAIIYCCSIWCPLPA